ncbi:MAG: hypothetical protein ACOC4E_00655 [Patescibacteria group bacterium]
MRPFLLRFWPALLLSAIALGILGWSIGAGLAWQSVPAPEFDHLSNDSSAAESAPQPPSLTPNPTAGNSASTSHPHALLPQQNPPDDLPELPVIAVTSSAPLR